LVFTNPDDPASQAIRQVARGLIALAPQRALPVLDEQIPEPPQASGMSLPMA
jgi:hypothetical protein